MSIDIAVIGAGWAGLSAARRLADAGREPVVFDKARGPGGRSSTRRQDGFSFDHGAQYFTARDPGFQSQVAGWRAADLVAPWTPRLRVFGERPEQTGTAPDERLVGVPGMNAVLKHLADGLDCRFGQTLTRIIAGDHWRLQFEDGEEIRAQHLLLTAPPAQCLALLQSDHGLAAELAGVSMSPAWALLLAYRQPLEADFDAAFVNEGPLSWIARNASKPGRSGESWVVQAGSLWSASHLEDQVEAVIDALSTEFARFVPAAKQQRPALQTAHRWRYALSPAPLAQGFLAAAEEKLWIAGDWCQGNRIEGAWLSGQAAAKAILAS